MGHNQGHSKRHLADMNIPPAEPEDSPAWEPPPDDQCTEYTSKWNLGGPGQLLIMRLQLDERDRVVEFAVMQMTRYGESYREVARVDTAHGTVHVHQLYGNQDDQDGQVIRDLYKIESQEDVEHGLDLAIDFIQDNWDENRRRWRDGR